jgi:hypothetical protein
VRLNGRGGGTALCPFHDDHRPSLSIYRSRRDYSERFRCWSCGSRGDVFDFAQTLLDYPDHTATLRALATERHLPWPENQEPFSSDVLDRAAQFYAGRLTASVIRYLGGRGFPDPFVCLRRMGCASVSSSRDLLVREIRSMARSNGTQLPPGGHRGRAPWVGRSSSIWGTLSPRFTRRLSPCGGRQLPGGLVLPGPNFHRLASVSLYKITRIFDLHLLSWVSRYLGMLKPGQPQTPFGESSWSCMLRGRCRYAICRCFSRATPKSASDLSIEVLVRTMSLTHGRRSLL